MKQIVFRGPEQPIAARSSSPRPSLLRVAVGSMLLVPEATCLSQVLTLCFVITVWAGMLAWVEREVVQGSERGGILLPG